MTETCPSCKSNDRDVRRDADCDGYDSPCTYSWHDAKEEKMADDPVCHCGVSLSRHNIMEDGHTFVEYMEAPAQATREQLEAALKEGLKILGEYHGKDYPDSCHKCKWVIESERLLGGK